MSTTKHAGSGELIAPHGGKLVNRIVDAATARSLAEKAASMPTITLSAKQACDLEMIAIGAFSPLEGFVGKADFESICRNMRLKLTALSGRFRSRWPLMNESRASSRKAGRPR
jgi:ATP sulfurylase